MLNFHRWLRTHPVDIVHTYLWGFHAVAGIPARILKTPVVLSSRREVPLWKKARHRWLENFGNLFVDRVVCCSKAVEEWTRRNEMIRSEKLITVYNGIDIDHFQKNHEGARRGLDYGIPQEGKVVGPDEYLSRVPR